MKKSTKVKIVAGAAAAVAVAGGGAAIAASQPWSPKAESQAVIDDAAKQLGVDPSDLSDALKRALKDRVDAAVTAGRLTKAQGDALQARIDAGGTPLVFGGFGRGGFDHADLFGDPGAAASYLGLTEDDLHTKLEGGKTLAQIAKDQGKTVDGLVQALVKGAETRIDAAVSDGRLTKGQADELKSGLERRITDLVNGAFRLGDRFRRGPGLGFGHGLWPGQGPRQGLWRHGFWPGQGLRSPPDFRSDRGPRA